MKPLKLISFSLIILIIAFFVSCSPENIGQNKSEEPINDDYVLVYGEIVSIEQAKDIALTFSKLPKDALFTKLDTTEDNDKNKIYKIEIKYLSSIYKIDLRAYDGMLICYNFDGYLSNSGTEIGQERAKQIISKMVSGSAKAIDNIQMEKDSKNDDGLPVYEGEIMLNDELYKYEIHTISGKLLQLSPSK